MASGAQSATSPLTTENPSRIWRRARMSGGEGWSSLGCIQSSASTTAMKLPALAAKHHPVPMVAMRIPPTAGPTARAALTSVEFRLTALRSWSGPTISSTNDCWAGLLKQLTIPSNVASTATSTNDTDVALAAVNPESVAAVSAGRHSSSTSPWKALPPLLVTMLITPPTVAPYSAEKALASTLISATAETGSVLNSVWRPQLSLFVAPSVTNNAWRRPAPLVVNSV